jgi:hypothetical protein
LQCCRDRQEQRCWLADETPKFVALIKGSGRVVLGVDNQREYCRFGARRACGGVDDKRTAESDGENAGQFWLGLIC